MQKIRRNPKKGPFSKSPQKIASALQLFIGWNSRFLSVYIAPFHSFYNQSWTHWNSICCVALKKKTTKVCFKNTKTLPGTQYFSENIVFFCDADIYSYIIKLFLFNNFKIIIWNYFFNFFYWWWKINSIN